MTNEAAFTVNKMFFLEDGKTVFAGNFTQGIKKFGLYSLSVRGVCIQNIEISGQMLFPSKTTDEIAIYTYDYLDKTKINTDGKIELKFIE